MDAPTVTAAKFAELELAVMKHFDDFPTDEEAIDFVGQWVDDNYPDAPATLVVEYVTHYMRMAKGG